MTQTRQNSGDRYVNVKDLSNTIREIVKAETAVLLKKIEKLEATITSLCEINSEIKASVIRKSDELPHVECDLQELDTSSESVFSTDTVIDTKKTCDKQNERRKKKPIKKSSANQNHNPKVNDDLNPRAEIRGSVESNSTFQARKKKIWLYVGRCNEKTTEADVKTYVGQKWQNHDFEVIELNSKGTSKSFRISVDHDEELMTLLYEPTSWPKNILVKRFMFFRQNNSGRFSTATLQTTSGLL